MAGPHFKRKLIHQAVVQRTTQTQNTQGELIDSWGTVGTIDVRYVQQNMRMADEAAGYPMIVNHLLLCNTGEDITEEDRVTNITFKSTGVSVDTSVLGRNTSKAHHISVKLERVE